MTYTPNTPPHANTGGTYGFARSGYVQALAQDLKTSDIEGATVYGRDDEKIGSVSALTVGTTGQITDALIDVGGFLGIGVHSVLIQFSALTVLREADGSDVRVHLDTTREKLKAMPHHDS